MRIRFSVSLEKPTNKISEFKFLLQHIIHVVTSDNMYKPPAYKRIKIIGKIFFINSQLKDRQHNKPQTFNYSADDDLLVKSAIESQVVSIMQEHLPPECNIVKMKFIVYFYVTDIT